MFVPYSLLTTIRVILPKTWLAKMAPAVPIPPTIIMKRPTMMSKVLSPDTLAGLLVIAKYVLLLTCMPECVYAMVLYVLLVVVSLYIVP